MKIEKLLACVGVWACFTACAAQRSPDAKTAAPAEQEPAALPEGAPGAPAPAAAPAPPGLAAPESKAAEHDAEFSNLEAAERALNQAQADLNRLALAEPSAALGRDATADRSAEKKQQSKPSRAPSAAGAAAPSQANSVCEDTCRAFSSLSRAASAVCRLDGSNGKHCSHAKQVLSDAQQRVASCSCPASSD